MQYYIFRVDHCVAFYCCVQVLTHVAVPYMSKTAVQALLAEFARHATTVRWLLDMVHALHGMVVGTKQTCPHVMFWPLKATAGHQLTVYVISGLSLQSTHI